MSHLGDYDASAVVYGKFTTYRPSTGAAFTLAGTPALSVYKDNSTTQSTTGVTLTADFDSVTGLNHFAIDTSADGTFYSAGSFFSVVITTGTVDSVSVVGAVVAEFTIRKNSALKPATAGRTLVVDASGLADANAVKVGPSGSGTAQTAGDIIGDTNDIQSRLPAALVSGRIDASVGAMAAGVVTAAAVATDAIDADAIAADAVTEIQSGLSTLNAAGVRTAVGLASANLDTQLSTIAGYVDTEVAAIKAKTDNLPASPAATSDIPSAATVAGAVWDEALAGHATAGSAGAALSAASSGSDPAAIADAVWDEATSGHQSAGTTGKALTDAQSAGDPWAATLEGSFTASDLLRIVAAANAGKTSIVKTGSGTATVTFRDVSDASDIMVGTAVNSERTAVTLTP